MRWLDSITNSTDMNLSKLRDSVIDREAWHVAVHGVTKSWTQLSNWAHALHLSDQFSRSVVSDSVWPHGLQHIRLPFLSPTPGACSNSCPLSWWCYPTISSSVMLFYFCFQSFPASGTFPMSRLLPIRWPKFWSFSLSISPSNEYSELISFRMDWFDLLAVQGTLKSLLQHHSSKASIIQHSAFLIECEWEPHIIWSVLFQLWKNYIFLKM